MVDLEHIPEYTNGFYLLRFNLEEMDIEQIREMFEMVKDTLRMNGICTPLIALPDDIYLSTASKKDLLKIRDFIYEQINHSD